MRKRLPFLGKKGTLAIRQQIIHLGKWLAFVASLFILMSYVKSINDNTDFYKTFLSRDLALFETTVYSLPGDLEYKYSFEKLDLGVFKFEFKQSGTNQKPVVSVEEKGIAKTYPYANHPESKYPVTIYNQNTIKFSKKGEAVDVKSE